jgi:uncharacterized protein YutE (UPF0331/DUF86 family)
MGELLLRKVLLCRDRIQKIRGALPATPTDILKDERTEAFLAFNLLLLIQDAIDLSAHLIAERGLGIPTSQRDTFQILCKAGLITIESADAMSLLASLRNRIAHTYGDLDPVRMVSEAPGGLTAAERFLDELIRSTGASGPG